MRGKGSLKGTKKQGQREGAAKGEKAEGKYSPNASGGQEVAPDVQGGLFINPKVLRNSG